MQIILMSGRLGRARSISLSARHLLATALLAVALLCAATGAVYWLTLRYAADLPIPALHKLVLASTRCRCRAAVSASCI